MNFIAWTQIFLHIKFEIYGFIFILQDGICPGSNLLYAVEVLVSGVCANVTLLIYNHFELVILLFIVLFWNAKGYHFIPC